MIVDLSYLDYQQDVFFNWPDDIKYKIIPKGRRVGITKGGCNSIIETLADKQGPVLWGDTIHGNIDRYFQRYIYPELRANNIRFHWESQRKQLTIGSQYCDFRSADNPENWEGFGYKLIFLNEAGIILKNRELYTNTVLPMLLDYKDSRLIAAGVPKGKMLPDGAEHPFYTLYKRALVSPDRYYTRTFTSYDNPLLDRQTIAELEQEITSISPQAIRQEIYGEFLDTDAVNPFAHQFDEAEHTSEDAVSHETLPLYISMDFNLNPYAVTFWHVWQDVHRTNVDGIGEFEMMNGSIPGMIQYIRSMYGHKLHSCILTGDSMGNQGNMARKDNASHYQEIARELRLGAHQIKVPANPTHENSRVECNSMFHISKQPGQKVRIRLHPKAMKNTIQDLKIVQCDAFGAIIKKNRKDLNQRADYLDTLRSLFHLANLQYNLLRK